MMITSASTPPASPLRGPPGQPLGAPPAAQAKLLTGGGAYPTLGQQTATSQVSQLSQQDQKRASRKFVCATYHHSSDTEPRCGLPRTLASPVRILSAISLDAKIDDGVDRYANAESWILELESPLLLYRGTYGDDGNACA